MMLHTVTILAGSSSAFVSALLAAYALLRLRETRAALPFACLMLVNVIYAGAYTFEINSADLAGAVSWLRLEYFGVTFVPVFWFVFARAFVRDARPMGAGPFALLCVIPLVTIGLMWTNGSHGLLYRSFRLQEGIGLSVIVGQRGSWYWVNTAYLYVLMLYGTVTVVAQVSRAAGKFRGQMLLISSAAILPWVGHALLIVRASPWSLDLTPFLLAISGGLLSWGIFKFSMFDLVPIARDMAVDAMSDGVIVADRKGRLVDANRAALGIFPLLSSMEIGADVLALFRQVGVELPGPGMGQEFSLGGGGGARCYKAIRLEIEGEAGPRGSVIIVTDMTREKEFLARLELLVSTDELTKVDNRRRFFEHAARELELAQRRGTSLAFAMLDLDNFKTVNDSRGHAAGDAALVAVCGVCRDMLRSTDILCRFGGEEFMIILPGAGPREAYEIVERVRRRIGQTVIGQAGEGFTVTASFGVAGSDGPPRDDLETWLRRADEAMYRAKAGGRNRTALAGG